MLDEVAIELFNYQLVQLDLGFFVDIFILWPLELIFVSIWKDVFDNFLFEFVPVLNVGKLAGNAFDSVEVQVWGKLLQQ